MRKTTIICIGALFLAMSSCQKEQASFKTDEVMMTDAHHLTVNDDSTFTGEVWDESHRICIELKNGQKSKISATHANGQVAVTNDLKNSEVHFYDESGKEITKAEFAKQYQKMLMEFSKKWEEESRQ